MNDHVVALCASEPLEALLFSLPAFKYNIIALHFIHEEIRCSEDHAAEVAHARYEEKKLDEHRTRAGRTVQSPIVLSDEGDKDEDDTGRLSELIALAEVSLQVEEAKDDTGRLSELIALVDAGL